MRSDDPHAGVSHLDGRCRALGHARRRAEQVNAKGIARIRGEENIGHQVASRDAFGERSSKNTGSENDGPPVRDDEGRVRISTSHRGIPLEQEHVVRVRRDDKPANPRRFTHPENGTDCFITTHDVDIDAEKPYARGHDRVHVATAGTAARSCFLPNHLASLSGEFMSARRRR